MPTTEVDVVDNAFEAPVIAVERGATVTWTWRDTGTDHNVVGDGFASDLLEQGSFAHTFAAEGAFPYRCTIHGGMVGEVRVGFP